MKTIDIEFDEYPGDTFALTISPIPLAVFEKVNAGYPEAVGAFQNKGQTDQLRAYIGEFVKVAKPTRNGRALTADKLLEIDPNLAIQLVRQWHAGVRNVPLPLPRGSGVTDRVSPAT